MKVHSILYYLSFVSYETNIILKNITFANVAQFVFSTIMLMGGHVKGYCLNPNSTNSSVQQNLRFRLHSYTIIHPTTNYLLLLLTAPASQALRLYNYTLTASQAGRLY